jgi:hypothetical protein
MSISAQIHARNTRFQALIANVAAALIFGVGQQRGWLAPAPGGLFTLNDHAGKTGKPGQ